MSKDSYLKEVKRIHVKNWIKQIKITVKVLIPLYVVVFFFRGCDAQSEAALNAIIIEVSFLFVILFLLIIGFFFYMKKQNYEREVYIYKQFINKLKNIEIERFPFAFLSPCNSQDIEMDSISESIPFEVVKMDNNEQEAFLEKKLEELESLTFKNSLVSEVQVKLKELRSSYLTYVNRAFNELIMRHQIQLEWINELEERLIQYTYHIQEINDTYNKHLGIIQSGNRGERRVEEELEQLSYFSTYLSNVRIEVNGSSVETDSIIISQKGIFLLEVKNFSESGKYSLRITKDGQWQRVYNDGIVEPMEKDVTAQHNRHQFLIERFIFDQWREFYGEEAPMIQFHPFIVIANDIIQIENQTDLAIIRISQIYHHIQKFDDKLSRDLLDKVQQIFETKRLPLKAFPLPDYTKGLEIFRERLEMNEKFVKEFNDLLTDVLLISK